MGNRIIIGLWGFLLASLTATIGPAQEKDAVDKKAAAKDAFNEGSRLFDEGAFVEASAAFRRSMSLAPSWKLYYNIGHSEAAAKRYGMALEAFQLYLAEAGDAIPEDRETEVVEQIRELKNKVGSVRVTAPEGAVIFIDDVQRGVAPMVASMKVAAGRDQHVVVKLGEEVLLDQTIRVWAEEEIALVAGQKQEEPPSEEVPPPEAPVEKEPAPVEVEEEKPAMVEIPAKDDDGGIPVVQTIEQKHPLRITGAVLLTVGAVGLAAGAATGVVTIIKAKQLEENCPGQVCTTEEDETDLKVARAMAKVTTIALPVGGGLALTGLVLMIVGRRLERKGMSSFNVLPVVGPGFSGISLERSF